MKLTITKERMESVLGEPDEMSMAGAVSTLMRYRMKWACGCRAETLGTRADVTPCRTHVDGLNVR
jgi:hypothetical protein